MMERCSRIPGCAGTPEQLRTGSASLQQGCLHWELSRLRDQLQRSQGDRTGLPLPLVMALDRHNGALPGSIAGSSRVPASPGQRHHPSNFPKSLVSRNRFLKQSVNIHVKEMLILVEICPLSLELVSK